MDESDRRAYIKMANLHQWMQLLARPIRLTPERRAALDEATEKLREVFAPYTDMDGHIDFAKLVRKK